MTAPQQQFEPMRISRADHAVHLRRYGSLYADAIAAATVSEDADGITYDPGHPAWVAAQAEQVRRRVAAREARLAADPELAAEAAARRAQLMAERGRALWAELHQAEGADAAWLTAWLLRVPCGECRTAAAALIRETPAVYGDGFFEWSVGLHNSVNKKLGRPEVSVDAARLIWGR